MRVKTWEELMEYLTQHNQIGISVVLELPDRDVVVTVQQVSAVERPVTVAVAAEVVADPNPPAPAA